MIKTSSLWFKLTGAFLSVAVLGIIFVAVFANRATITGLEQYMIRGQLIDAQDLVVRLETFYANQGDWTGVSTILGERRGAGRGGGYGSTGLMLADADGKLVAGASSDLLGQSLPESQLATGVALVVDGSSVGTLMVSGNGFGQIEQEYLRQVNRGLIWGGLGAILVALLLGTILAWRIATPVRKLTGAAKEIATGNLTSRVSVDSRDEIGLLGEAFNRMAHNLAQADQLRRHMTADIAHELRTPLSIIRGQIEAILDGLFPPDEKHLIPIHEETLLLTRLVEDLRTLAQAEAGQLALERTSNDPGLLLERVLAKFTPLVLEKSIELVIDLPPETPLAFFDRDRIEQVLTNLFSNAIRHTPNEGTITVRLSMGNTIAFSVTNTGIGLSPDEIPYVFDRFWRGDRARSRDRAGSGLGLAIARQFVKAHGGDIGVTSFPGGPTSFEFFIPLVSSPRA